MLYDTHCHPYLAQKKSQDTILEDFFKSGKNSMISVGCTIDSSITSIELAKKYPLLKAAIGFHPCDIPLNTNREKEIEKLTLLYKKYKDFVVAIGEIGLDYYWINDISGKTGLSQTELKKIQKKYFKAQIQLAKKLELPFIIHSRESNTDVLDILEEEKAHNYVFHCFSGNWEFAQNILEQNPEAMFGFGGVLTFKKSLELQEVVRKLPLKNIIIETDSPFLTPEPLRGKEENEPLYVGYVLKKIQELREENPEEIENQIFHNSISFFQKK